MDANPILNPGDAVGILGGGQLGRMTALAAARLGLKSHVFCPDAASPAFDVATSYTVAEYEDYSALKQFAESVNVVTYEFENVPHETAAELAKHTVIRPDVHPLLVCQDRWTEKNFLSELGIFVAPYASIECLEDIAVAANQIGLPAILKTRRFGYDGKGQASISELGDAANAWQSIGEAPAVLERRMDFAAECSVCVARGLDGSVACYDVAENAHEQGILQRSRVPATSLDSGGRQAVQQLGERIAAALDYVGVLAVELFVLDSGLIAVNEIAPRPHNSGHWTEDGCYVSQFEQHIRAIAGWPLGSPRRHSDIEMENLVGADVLRWREILAEPNARLHVYGKSIINPGRKMGHVNRILN